MFAWTSYGGTFNASSHALVAGNSVGGKSLIRASFDDFVLEADIVIPNPSSGNAGLLFRVSNPSNGVDNYSGYFTGIGTDGFIVLGRAKNDWTHLSMAKVEIRPGQVHYMKVRASGDSITIYVDDMSSPKIDLKDGTYSKGMIGVRVFQTDATFDNIRISHI